MEELNAAAMTKSRKGYGFGRPSSWSALDEQWIFAQSYKFPSPPTAQITSSANDLPASRVSRTFVSFAPFASSKSSIMPSTSESKPRVFNPPMYIPGRERMWCRSSRSDWSLMAISSIKSLGQTPSLPSPGVPREGKEWEVSRDSPSPQPSPGGRGGRVSPLRGTGSARLCLGGRLRGLIVVRRSGG